MICPTCGWDNLPGNEACTHCQQDLTPLDRPAAASRVERGLMEERVSILKIKPPTTIDPDATIRQAIEFMLEKNVGALLVVDATNQLLGIFSERDVLEKVAGNSLEDPNLTVGKFMTPRPATVSLEDTLDFVLHRMDGGNYRHVPVVAQGQPLGVVSVRDMLRYITSLCKDG